MATRERRLRSDEYDRIIRELFLANSSDEHSIAIAAVGSYGRGELAPGSDLDLVVLHNGEIAPDVLGNFVNNLLYPLWDRKLKVDHSVRTVGEAVDAIQSDLKVAMGLLDIRLICGSADLVAEVQLRAIEIWRKNFDTYMQWIEESLRERHQRAGELAYLLEPDLKESRGGLRDITIIRALRLADRIHIPIERISHAESLLLTVRESLHIVSGKDRDKLLFQEQDLVAAALEYRDADALMAEVAQAARSVDYLMQLSLHRIHHKGRDGLGRFIRRPRTQQISPGITVANREVAIDPFYDFDSDPVIGLRAAASAAQLGLPLSIESLEKYAQALAEGRGALPSPWPREAREYLIALIGAGESMVHIFEALDQEEVIFHWIPEWRNVRSLPQRNVLHRHTVDRHMVETAVAAAALTREVHRPDLLLFTALFHDIGKGSEEDHSMRGARLIHPIAARVGFSERDCAVIATLIENHLLLSATATRRDLDDPATIASVSESIRDIRTLELLHALSIADGIATGKAAWSDWKATLVADLVRRTELALTDNSFEAQPEFSPQQSEIAAAGELAVNLEDRGAVIALEIIVPDQTGVLSVIAGVLNVLRLDVRAARTKTLGSMAVMEWIVAPDPHAPEITSEKVYKKIADALVDISGIAAAIEKRISDYAQLPSIPVPPPIVETFLDAATSATIIEVRSHDRPALLYSIGDAVAQCNIDIRAAIVTTLGAEAIDTLYVTEIGGEALSAQRASEVAAKLSESLK